MAGRSWSSATPSTAATARCWRGSGASPPPPGCWWTTPCWRWAVSPPWAATPGCSTAGTPSSTRCCCRTRASVTSSVSERLLGGPWHAVHMQISPVFTHPLRSGCSASGGNCPSTATVNAMPTTAASSGLRLPSSLGFSRQRGPQRGPQLAQLAALASLSLFCVLLTLFGMTAR